MNTFIQGHIHLFKSDYIKKEKFLFKINAVLLYNLFILKWFLKKHVTLKTEAMAAFAQYYNITECSNAALVSIRDFNLI